MSRTVLGHTVVRSEDPDLLTGRARFLADLDEAGTLEVVFVRSTIAHGSLVAVDGTEARSRPGVDSVWRAADLDLAPAGAPPALARPPLATDRVRFVGEPVAAVLAASLSEAVDAAEAVRVDIDPLPVVLDPVAAAGEDATRLFPDHGTNVVGGRHHEPAFAFFTGADVVASFRLRHNRVAPVTMEANGAMAVPSPDGSMTLWVSTQSVFGVRDEVARSLAMEPDQVRVRAPWVGGGFGAKGGVYPEVIVVAALARRLGRPVRWVESRPENLVNMTHGRGQVHDVDVGIRADGRLVGLHVRSWADTGAYPSRGGFIPMVTRFMSAGVYRWEQHDFSAVTTVTNTTPTGPYRGAGRPEAAALVERAVDVAAGRLGLDPWQCAAPTFHLRPSSPSAPPPVRSTTAGTTAPPWTGPSRSWATTRCAPSRSAAA